MELAIIGVLIYLGSRKQINNNDIYDNKDDNVDKKDVNIDKNIYDSIDYIYNDNDYDKNIKKIEKKSNIITKSKYPEKTNIINNSIKSINNISVNYKNMNSKFYQENVKNLDNSQMTESFNQNLNNSKESYEDQFKPLIFDNKEKPSSVNQPHNSINKNNLTSIERSLAIGDGYSFFNEDNDMTYGISNENDFTHSNMIPHFSKKQVINDYNEQTLAHKVDIFSGSSKNFIPKKEVLLENFAPVQKDVNLVNGSKNNLEFMKSYYLPSKEKRNQLPFEQENVGPGLNLAPEQSIRPDGGQQEEYRPLPKNVDELRSADNPKISYEGVVVPGQKGSKRGNIGKVYKRRPEKTIEIDPKTFQKSGGEYKKTSSRNPIILKNTTRTNSRPVIGPATYAVSQLSKKNDAHVKESNKKETASSGPSNVGREIKKFSQNKSSYELQQTRRDTTCDNEHIAHPHNFSLSVIKFDPHDLPKQTIKQTTIFNEHSGVAQGAENKVSAFNPNDITKPTVRQYTMFNEQAGYARGEENKVGVYNPDDITKPTLRQDTMFNQQAGYARGEENKVTTYDPDDITKPTLRQDTMFNQQAGYARGEENKVTTYDPDDITKPTLRQDTMFNQQAGYAKSLVNQGLSYDPDDQMKMTQRQDLTYNDNVLNFRSEVNKNPSYDPEDILKLTQRQDLAYNDDILNVRGEVNHNPSYDPNDITKTTQRQGLTHNSNILNTKSQIEMNKVYNPNDLMKTTHREDIVYTNQSGHARNEVDAPIYYNPSDLSRPTNKEELVYTNRDSNVMGSNTKPKAFDPSNIPAPTLKDLLVKQYDIGVAQGIVNKSKSFNPKDVPAETLKQMLVINNHLSNANREDSHGGGYLSNKYQAPDTLRQLMQILRFGGALGDQAPRDYSAEKNMQLDDRKETAIKSRYPTDRKYDVIPSTETNVGNLNLRNPINIERTPIINRSNSHSNNFNLPTNYIQNNNKQEESNRLNPEILNQLNNNPLVNNIVISQPDNSNNNNC